MITMAKIKLDDKQLKKLLPDDLPEYLTVDNDIVKDINSTRRKDKLSPYYLDISAYKEFQRLPIYHFSNGVNRRGKIIEV
jgi:hypothetical protein